MAFKDELTDEIENIGSGEKWNDDGLILSTSNFQKGLIIGRFAQVKNGIICNLDGGSKPVIAGVPLRSVVNAIEAVGTYDTDIHCQCSYKRQGLVPVDVKAGDNPKLFDKCYLVNTADGEIGKVTTSDTGTIKLNAEFIQEIKPGVWLINIISGITA